MFHAVNSESNQLTHFKSTRQKQKATAGKFGRRQNQKTKPKDKTSRQNRNRSYIFGSSTMQRSHMLFGCAFAVLFSFSSASSYYHSAASKPYGSYETYGATGYLSESPAPDPYQYYGNQRPTSNTDTVTKHWESDFKTGPRRFENGGKYGSFEHSKWGSFGRPFRRHHRKYIRRARRNRRARRYNRRARRNLRARHYGRGRIHTHGKIYRHKEIRSRKKDRHFSGVSGKARHIKVDRRRGTSKRNGRVSSYRGTKNY